MIEVFSTISSLSTGIYKEKGSKFISFAIPVTSKEDINECIKKYKKDYYDARHVCYAYMFGAEREDYKLNDDGEPSGTAGRPIMGQINSFQLTNILIIVVRYFGGVLLGTGGLNRAYKESALDAIRNAQIIQKNIEIKLHLSFDYGDINSVMLVIKDFPHKILEQSIDNYCYIKIEITKEFENQFTTRLSGIASIKYELID